ncbi:superoxide dismutase family protein [Rhizohabitans arisaemae]|uniref:superoxide dismutase family protein n=1 Tax=Rhizohabitans arisaemae TaxID=2720610 RepID=UPI0024B0701A|nr:superoxide dismutase family protein [Rhizohabitans arisaemae]
MARNIKRLVIAAVSVAVIGGIAASTMAMQATDTDKEPLQVQLKDVNGNSAGWVSINLAKNGKTRITGRVWKLSPGYHGFHIHSVGICDPKSVDPATGKVTPFFSAGPHADVGGHLHGEHTGDLPTLLAGEDGSAEAASFTDRFHPEDLRDADGSAVIVHVARDNYAHIPPRYTGPGGKAGPDEATNKTGDAGDRIVCGVIPRR